MAKPKRSIVIYDTSVIPSRNNREVSMRKFTQNLFKSIDRIEIIDNILNRKTNNSINDIMNDLNIFFDSNEDITVISNHIDEKIIKLSKYLESNISEKSSLDTDKINEYNKLVLISDNLPTEAKV